MFPYYSIQLKRKEKEKELIEGGEKKEICYH